MSALPRILAIIGSGETTPTMTRVHRAILARLGPAASAGVLLDTPYGFQENAGDITARALEYFRESVGQPLGVASFLSAEVDGATRATALSRLQEAAFVFSGPGSPSYALNQWLGSEIPGVLARKLESGGAVVFASAAALTLGLATVPVYEIYKVGERPHWLRGLDLLSPIGLRVAVIPHYDNAEGGNHDTRFCYLGERRLRLLEEQLPEDSFILGVDGHTALVLDLDEMTATVEGLGTVTVRLAGASRVFDSGSRVPIGALRPPPAAEQPALRAEAAPGEGGGMREFGGPSAHQSRPLEDELDRLKAGFEDARASRDPVAAAAAALALEETLVAWSRDTEESAVLGDARTALRTMVVRLGDLALEGVRDPSEVLAPFVETLLELRLRARELQDWGTADMIRDRLASCGVAVHDRPETTSWELRDLPSPR